MGEIDIDIPRDRKGEFEPIVVPKHSRDISRLENQIIELYGMGNTPNPYKFSTNSDICLVVFPIPGAVLRCGSKPSPFLATRLLFFMSLKSKSLSLHSVFFFSSPSIKHQSSIHQASNFPEASGQLHSSFFFFSPNMDSLLLRCFGGTGFAFFFCLLSWKITKELPILN